MIIFYGERENNGKIWYNKKIINSKRGIILKIKDFFVYYIKHYYCILNFDINKKVLNGNKRIKKLYYERFDGYYCKRN